MPPIAPPEMDLEELWAVEEGLPAEDAERLVGVVGALGVEWVSVWVESAADESLVLEVAAAVFEVADDGVLE